MGKDQLCKGGQGGFRWLGSARKLGLSFWFRLFRAVESMDELTGWLSGYSRHPER